MARPISGSGKVSIKGTRAPDTITVLETGVSINGAFKPFAHSTSDIARMALSLNMS